MKVTMGMARKVYLLVTIIITIPLLLFAYYDSSRCRELLLERKEQQLIEAAYTLERSLIYSFDEIIAKENAQKFSPEEQVKVLNRYLQPLVMKVWQDYPSFGLVFYSLGLEKRVAVAPKFRPEVMMKITDPNIRNIYKTGQLKVTEIKSSMTWNGKPALAAVFPIYHDHLLIGHVAANTKMEDINREFYVALTKRIAAIFLVWLAVLVILSQIFHKLQSSLAGLAQQIRSEDDNPDNFTDFPELLPVLETTIALRENLKKKSNILQWMLENIPGGFLAIDNSGQVTFANLGSYELLGLKKDQESLVGKEVDYIAKAAGVLNQEKVPLLKSLEDGLIMHRDKMITENSYYQFDASPIRDPESGQIVGAAAYFDDISEEEKKNRELEEMTKLYLNEARNLQQLIDTLPLAILAIDNQARITAINEAELAYFSNLRKEDFIGQSLRVFTEAVNVPYEHSLVLRALKGEVVRDANLQFLGREFVVNAYQIRDIKNQEIIGALEICEDVTERKLIQDKLKEQAELLDLSRNYIFVRDLNYEITFWNKGAEAGYGWNKEEAIGKTSYELLQTKFPKSVCGINQEILSQGYWEGELIHTRQDGKEIVVESYWTLKKDEVGNPMAILQIDNDITKVKEEQEKERLLAIKYQNEAEKMNQLIELCPLAILVINSEGRITRLNQAYLDHLSNLTKEEVIGKSYQFLTKILGIDYQSTPIIRALEGEKIKEECSDTLGRNWLINALPIKDIVTSQIRGAMAIYHDVTEYEQMREEMGKLDRLNLIGEMAAGVAHEIRNPMTAARGYLQLLMTKSEGKSQGYFKVVIEELDRANSIISDFLSLARNRPCGKKEQNLNEIIMSIYPLVYGDAMKRGVNVHLELAESLPLISLNEKEMKQVILNLSRNAIEAMGEKGRLIIQTKNHQGKLQLSISDTGCGIPQDQLNKIFNPFYTTKEEGTGLGLAVCSSIINRHQGIMDVKSQEGQGTVFTITFGITESKNQNIAS